MSIRSILFEAPYTLIPILVGVELVLLGIWSRRRTPLTGRMALGGLIAIPLLVAAQFLVVTEQERIIRLCRELAKAVGQADIAAIGPHISEDFQVRCGDRLLEKSELLDEVERVLAKWDVEEERLGAFEIVVHGEAATSAFQATCRLISNDLEVPRHVSRWRIKLAKTDAAWQVTHIQPVATALSPYDSLLDLLR